jgi:hypothetical protein
MSIIANVETYKKRIAGDIITVGGTVAALIAIVVNVAPSVHIPATATASLIAASSIIATVIQQVRRVNRNKIKPDPVPTPTPTVKKVASSKKASPAKKTAPNKKAAPTKKAAPAKKSVVAKKTTKK